MSEGGELLQTVIDDLPPEVKVAQRRVTLAIAGLEPPAGFGVLIDVLAAEMTTHGIVPGSPLFESFLQLQIRALVQRTRGICAEQGIELEEGVEAPVPAPKPVSWWRRWG